ARPARPQLESSSSELSTDVVTAATVPASWRNHPSFHEPEAMDLPGQQSAGGEEGPYPGQGGEDGLAPEAERESRYASDCDSERKFLSFGGGPIFRRIGPSARAAGSVSLWASVAPVVSHIVSGAGPVTSPQTSAAWSFPR
ncbi:MAG: hypothetical protein ACYDBS_11020, partial [Acidimicrobiales bacterium]